MVAEMTYPNWDTDPLSSENGWLILGSPLAQLLALW